MKKFTEEDFKELSELLGSTSKPVNPILPLRVEPMEMELEKKEEPNLTMRLEKYTGFAIVKPPIVEFVYTKEPKLLHLKAFVSYWEDSEYNGISDNGKGELAICREGDFWCPIIEVDSGKILNWTQGIKALIVYKVCDRCGYTVKDQYDEVFLHSEPYNSYVPRFLSNGDSDYIAMQIDADGLIGNWHFDISDF